MTRRLTLLYDSFLPKIVHFSLPGTPPRGAWSEASISRSTSAPPCWTSIFSPSHDNPNPNCTSARQHQDPGCLSTERMNDDAGNMALLKETKTVNALASSRKSPCTNGGTERSMTSDAFQDDDVPVGTTMAFGADEVDKTLVRPRIPDSCAPVISQDNILAERFCAGENAAPPAPPEPNTGSSLLRRLLLRRFDTVGICWRCKVLSRDTCSSCEIFPSSERKTDPEHLLPSFEGHWAPWQNRVIINDQEACSKVCFTPSTLINDTVIVEEKVEKLHAHEKMVSTRIS